MPKKLFSYAFVVFISFILLNFMFDLLNDIYQSKRVNDKVYEIILVNIIAFILGILIEWKTVLQILKGKFKISLLVIPSILLLAISLIPHIYWVSLLGIGNTPLGIVILKSNEIHIILSVISGVLLTKSIYSNN